MQRPLTASDLPLPLRSQEKRLSGSHLWQNNTISVERDIRTHATSSCISAGNSVCSRALYAPPTSVFSIARTRTPSFQPIVTNIRTDILLILFILRTTQFFTYTILAFASTARALLFLIVQEGASFFDHVHLFTFLFVTKARHLWSSSVWFNPLTYMDPQQQQQPHFILLARQNPCFVVSFVLPSPAAFISPFLSPDPTVSTHFRVLFFQQPLSPRFVQQQLQY